MAFYRASSLSWDLSPSPSEQLCSRTNKSLYGGRILVHSSLKIWKQIKTYLKAPDMYTDSPICDNHIFKSSSVDSVLAHWKRKGVVSLKDLYQEGPLCVL